MPGHCTPRTELGDRIREYWAIHSSWLMEKTNPSDKEKIDAFIKEMYDDYVHTSIGYAHVRFENVNAGTVEPDWDPILNEPSPFRTKKVVDVQKSIELKKKRSTPGFENVSKQGFPTNASRLLKKSREHVMTE